MRLPRKNPRLPCVIGNPFPKTFPVSGKTLPHRSGDHVVGANPWSVWRKEGGCAKVRRAGDSDEAKMRKQGFRKVKTVESHGEADDLADRMYGGRVGNPSCPHCGSGLNPDAPAAVPGARSEVRSPTRTSTEVRSPTSTRTEVRSPTSTSTSTKAHTSGNFTATVTGGAGAGNTTVTIRPGGRGRRNPGVDHGSTVASSYGNHDELPRTVRANPKLMVVNPCGLEGPIERRLGRRLTKTEHAGLEKAVREFTTFFGRKPTPSDIMPVDAPPGTPLVVSMIGRLDRMDYTVPITSSRKGKWTHQAGDHGRTKKTPPAYIAAIPGRSKHNYTIVQQKGANTYFKPTHGIMG